MRRIVLTFGLIAGSVLAAMMVVQMAFIDTIGFEHGQTIGYTTMVVAFMFVFFGIRSYRDDRAGGTIRFGQAVRVGLLITLVASACYVLTWQIIYYGFDTDFIAKYTAYNLEKARASGASAAELAKQAADMARFQELYRNPLINAGITFIEVFPIGLVMTLVSAGILRRDRRPAADGAPTLGTTAPV